MSLDLIKSRFTARFFDLTPRTAPRLIFNRVISAKSYCNIRHVLQIDTSFILAFLVLPNFRNIKDLKTIFIEDETPKSATYCMV